MLSVERYAVVVDSVADFEGLAGRYVAQARDHPGSLWADLTRANDDDPSFIVLSEWRTTADLDAFEEARFAAFEEAVGVLLRADPTRRRFGSLK